jgi:hypothetical protein
MKLCYAKGLFKNIIPLYRVNQYLLQSLKRRRNKYSGGSEDCAKKWVLNRVERISIFIYKAPFDNGLTEHELDHAI